MSGARKVVILGSTGSVGSATLDLFERSKAEVEVLALVGGRNVAKLAEQARRWRPRRAVIADEALLPELSARLAGLGIETAAGREAAVEAAAMGADWVMAAIVGSAGLASTLAAARAGAVVALANKESLVCAGPALLEAADRSGGRIIPVDSEHSAIFQVLETHNAGQLRKMTLTASGGPFRRWSLAEMAVATPAQAVAHPNWSMGPKISVDSATMMNKGLEMIEAHYLFATRPERIAVVIHPESIVHSLVEYEDGSSLAQLGLPDMRTPIACAFAWPARLPWPAPGLDLAAIGKLTFESPDAQRFPAIELAREAMRIGGRAPAAFSAANEAAVAAFLDGEVGFLDIASVVEETLSSMHHAGELSDLGPGDALEKASFTDDLARRNARAAVRGRAARPLRA